MTKPIIPLPPYELLHQLLDYNPTTGVFHWKVKPCRNIAEGAVAGCYAHPTGRGQLKINKVVYKTYRIAYKMMTGEEPLEIDHIDKDPSNDRWDNLRNVTHQENCMNRRWKIE